ncbi:MAG: prolyl oligopeptidase family serine peptidase [Balneolaceae bacterium]
MSVLISGCQSDKLERISYNSEIVGEERDFFLYLPNGYETSDKNWPVLMFLHGNGERGNGKDELDFVKIHGPLYEAWIQKRDLPFIIIVPQLHMFGMDNESAPYLANRDTSIIPKRLAEGVPPRSAVSIPETPMDGSVSQHPEYLTLPNGWYRVENDLIGMIDHVLENFRADSNRVYLSGLSYGGFGAWHLASTHPEKFAALNPVVGWGHPDLMEPIAKQRIPVWAFAGGGDPVVESTYFFAGLNRLKDLGHKEVQFTIHEDMGHDTWKRVYAGEDIYSWLLSHDKISNEKRALHGSWENENGQKFVFNSDGTAEWIKGDETFSISYDFNPAEKPAHITLEGFETGSLAGKSLYGIAEFDEKRNSFTFYFESGDNESVRPLEFNPDQSQNFVRL